MKTFTVNIEQPLCKGFEIEAEDMQQAEDIAREKYASGELVLTADDLGTDALFQVIDEEEGDCTDWN